mmetsp:Transcript_32225/g.94797  ORF Transcript_32225/g.94797 Transcript_32225/m.94797 type:complete len:393 (-) Transcript_32225:200-1378(-)
MSATIAAPPRTKSGFLINESNPLTVAAHHYSPKVVLSASRGDVTIVTVCVGITRSFKGSTIVCSAVLRNIRDYARKHGYGVLFFDKNIGDSSDRHVLWAKIPALYYGFAHLSTPYLWWQDADSLFVLPERSLANLKPRPNNRGRARSLTIAGDHNCYINSGHFMLRKSHWTDQFLDDIWVQGLPGRGPQPWAWPEQAMILYIVSGRPAKCRKTAVPCCHNPPHVDANVDLRPNREVHVYLPDFVNGYDFIVHFARNVPNVHRPRDMLFLEWNLDPNRTAHDWNDHYAAVRAKAARIAAARNATLSSNQSLPRPSGQRTPATGASALSRRAIPPQRASHVRGAPVTRRKVNTVQSSAEAAGKALGEGKRAPLATQGSSENATHEVQRGTGKAV